MMSPDVTGVIYWLLRSGNLRVRNLVRVNLLHGGLGSYGASYESLLGSS